MDLTKSVFLNLFQIGKLGGIIRSAKVSKIFRIRSTIWDRLLAVESRSAAGVCCGGRDVVHCLLLVIGNFFAFRINTSFQRGRRPGIGKAGIYLRLDYPQLFDVDTK